MRQKTYGLIVCGLVIFAIATPTLVWGDYISWDIGSVSIYQWFPLFGLWAWMLMWTHYVSGALRIVYSKLKKIQLYSKMTGFAVLACLLLHPGLLSYAQFRNGQGLPPNSYLTYVGSSLALSVMLGSVALLIFLSFEIFDRIKTKPQIVKWWPAISFSQTIAMMLVFIHALNLGMIINSGWFLYVWWLCGIILLPCFCLIHAEDLNRNDENLNNDTTY